jgi:hypothetical protein
MWVVLVLIVVGILGGVGYAFYTSNSIITTDGLLFINPVVVMRVFVEIIASTFEPKPRRCAMPIGASSPTSCHPAYIVSARAGLLGHNTRPMMSLIQLARMPIIAS